MTNGAVAILNVAGFSPKEIDAAMDEWQGREPKRKEQNAL